MTNTFEVPLFTPSLANQREHWRSRARRARMHRGSARLLFNAFTSKTFAVELLLSGGTVSLVRVAPHLLDDDNLRGALKSVRDGIADGIGIDDRDKRITWEYSQERGMRATVRVAISYHQPERAA